LVVELLKHFEMTETFEPIDDFVRRVGIAAGDNRHAIIGPLSLSRRGGYVIEVAVARARSTSDDPVTRLTWDIQVGLDAGTAEAAPGKWEFLDCSLRRKFETVERCGDPLEFATTVEKQWPCAAATAVRGRLEAAAQRRKEWDGRRIAYVRQRVQDGVSLFNAHTEFFNVEPPA
jgi:hypothetical protein